MKFTMNNVIYTIKEVCQKEFWDHQIDKEDGYYYGQSHFQTQEIWIDKDLSIEKKSLVSRTYSYLY